MSAQDRLAAQRRELSPPVGNAVERPSWRVREAHAVDLLAPDHLPSCGSCGDLSDHGATICQSCGSRLVP